MQDQQTEYEEAEHEEVDILELRKQALERMPGHNWRIRGTIMECVSCPYKHSVILEPSQVERIAKELNT